MKDVHELLHQRICEYNQKWKYKKDNDMAACIVDILDEHFLSQQAKIEQLPFQKQNVFYNLLPAFASLPQRQYMRVFFESKAPVEIPVSTLIFAQDKEGNVAPYELIQPLFVQKGTFSRILNVDGDKQTICHIGEGQQKDMNVCTSQQGEQVHALYFHIPNMFDHNEDLAFALCLSCEETLWSYLLEPAYVKVYLQLDHERIELSQITRINHALHIKASLSEEQRFQIRGLWIQGVDISTLMPQHIWDASFLWQGNNLRCDHIFGEEQAYEREDVPLFGAPMRLYNSCYICENETLSNPEAMVTLHFNTYTKCIHQGMELLKSQEFRGIMRKLPLDIPVYDAYADVVVLEYFNGQAWCTLPHTQGIQSIFKQEKETSFQIRFPRPEDLKPCRVMGKFAYYLRFRLVKSEHLYQQPCHIHVPYIAHVRFHYTMRKHVKAQATFLYSMLHKEDITKQLGKEGCVIFARLPVKGKAIFLALQGIDWRYPCTCYIDLKHSQATGSSLCIEYAKQDTFLPLYIEDATDGLTHSGEITLMFPEHIQKTTLFEEEAYWLRLSFLDQAMQDIQINEIIWNTAIVSQKAQALLNVASMHIENMKDVNVKLLKGPYGNSETLSQEKQRTRIAHQFTTMRHPLSMIDIQKDILHAFSDVADVVLLEHQTAYHEPSEDCHVLVFVKDLKHHTSLFHIRKKAINTYLMQYEACISGKFIVEEPVFVRISIHARCRAPQDVLWQKQQELLSYLSAFFDPIHGGVFHKGIAIGECIDMDVVKNQCEKQIQDLTVLSWQANVSFQKHGKQYFYAYEDMPCMVGFLLISDQHRIEMEGC